ncbi:MAG: amidase [Litorivivens sp.]|jgi:amidase
MELMQHTLDRISRLNPGVNAIVNLAQAEPLLAEAKAADEALGKGEYRGWMHGFPHAVKDLANVRGFVTSFGSPLCKNNVAVQDDLAVQRIRQQGAIFIGKTNVPEFGLGSQSYNSVYGATGNAFNPTLTAGGSSGGAATALALGLLPVADGSDMMGSLRNPAGFNNVIGFRPGLGRVPAQSPELFFDQLATAGPMGRTVGDVSLLFATLAGFNSSVPLSTQTALSPLTVKRPADAAEFKVGWLADYDGYLLMEEGVLDLCAQNLQRLDASGMNIESIALDFPMAALWQSWLSLRHWKNTNFYGPRYDDQQQREQLKPEMIWEIEQGIDMSAAELYKACSVRSDWYRLIDKTFQDWDILALPSAQVFPFPIEQHWPDNIAGQSMDTYHRWMEVVIGGSLSGCPVISLPAGFDRQGRAMGIQFMAPMGEEEKLLQFALRYEEINPWVQHYRV